MPTKHGVTGAITRSSSKFHITRKSPRAGIPAIFAITTDTFVVWTSNCFVILGLRGALYFMLAGLMKRFVYLSVGLSIILVFVGVKFLISDIVGKVPPWVSLPFIATVAAVSILASLHKTRGQARAGGTARSRGDARGRGPS